eukprot:SAG22_NODE_9949_length_562_cov_0.531317_1_plen_46_part_00
MRAFLPLLVALQIPGAAEAGGKFAAHTTCESCTAAGFGSADPTSR